MISEQLLPAHADLVTRLLPALVTRTLGHVAEEARLDGESLRQALERYEIDYAWHVLGSKRQLDACVAALQARQGRIASAEQRTTVAAVLAAASAVQASDALMSFDNDVAEHLTGWMGAAASVG